MIVLENNVSRLSNDAKAVVSEASDAASQGAEQTKNMKAKAGRASYVAPEKVKLLRKNTIATSFSNFSNFKVNQSDPGAVAAAAWISSIEKNL